MVTPDVMPPRLHTKLLVKPTDVQPQFVGFEVIGTFNPAAVDFDGEVALLIRVVERPIETRPGYIALPFWNHEQRSVAVDWRSLDEVDLIDPRIVRIKASGHIRLTFISYLLPAFSRDGSSIDRFGEHPMLPATRYETFGVEDARLAKLDDRYYLTYVAVSPHGISTALASTADFHSFERHGIIFCPENKDVLLFPEKIGDEFVAFHRPNPNAHFSPPEIWLARSPDLIHWGRHERLLGAEASWASVKVGGGVSPIRTERGWLSLYHGHIAPTAAEQRAGSIGQYAAASMLLDLGDPRRIVGLSPHPIMRAEADFERLGYLPNIVFPTALLRRGESVDVYYGAADTCTGVARYALDDLLATIP
ncbi:glycoside hydrolase family 130 protein [Lacipirellula limnantheis]|uniref:Beta-1,4-mannooligosaccharide phosphorylase n=1 Tax=Lacipirellula limnantheis TaxID=2528024 RepID=A0A517TYR7_9BACT|nr:glycoside hydrolase family 130 protein [Lacipirellula limnantheis]QDT73519.1 Beta-1,4-mannooligosaccharide phosphorylase [Lacipirellula limnantheis]